MANRFFNLLYAVIKSQGMRRLSALNRMLDYMALQLADTKLLLLHNELQDILYESHRKWSFYDYGEGYFYQSHSPLSIRGLRNTDLRFKIYELDSILNREDRVLDIGCNSGFLSLMIARYCKSVDAFDCNPYLIQIAELCRKFEGRENVHFFNCSFDDLEITEPYSMVLSLANHHTFDGNMRPEFRTYMEQIRNICVPGGKLIFESHPGEHKKPFLKEQLESIQNLFQIDSEIAVNTKKSVYDTNRLVFHLRAV